MIGLQKNLFTKRWSKVRALEPQEYEIQIALVQRLKLIGRKDVLWFHVPNGEVRDKRVAAKLKAMGVMPGVADLLFFWKHYWEDSEGSHVNLRALFLELKASKRTQSDPQRHFEDRSKFIGIHYECADTIDKAVSILTLYGILPAKQAA